MGYLRSLLAPVAPSTPTAPVAPAAPTALVPPAHHTAGPVFTPLPSISSPQMDFTHLSATLGTNILLGSLTPRATSVDIEYLASYIRLPTTPPHSPSGGPSGSPYGDDDPDDDVPDYTLESPDYTPSLMASPMADPDAYFSLPNLSLDPSQLSSLVGTTPIEIIYISDDDEMDVDDVGAAIPLGEPKQEDPEEEEDPDEIEFYEDGE
ncbi:hypothetical protein GUJ93_ZPchr0006g42544 [Zizania palustris]|uniref:Uncharacterized protein n=1 Tax=Zizania palustris TaxID=103762 RepID=A0A8J5VQ87_ZIZPA|nr:hypothetical protein GUJ93_ZPchr0006g42544 [Zizania palustris]